jgi:hypothetical protein
MLGTLIQVEQGSDEWKRLRMGKVTTSRLGDFINFGKKTHSLGLSDSETAKTYKYELVAERILQRPMERNKFDSFWMKHGRDHESEAAHAFSEWARVQLDPGGFLLTHRFGSSPDRIVHGKNEAVEIKCPAPWTHLKYMIEGPGEAYELQVQGQMALGGYDVIHFWSYWPEQDILPPVYVRRESNKLFQRRLLSLIEQFCDEVDAAERIAYQRGVVPVMAKND